MELCHGSVLCMAVYPIWSWEEDSNLLNVTANKISLLELNLKIPYTLFWTHNRNYDCTRLYVLTLVRCRWWKVNWVRWTLLIAISLYSLSSIKLISIVLKVREVKTNKTNSLLIKTRQYIFQDFKCWISSPLLSYLMFFSKPRYSLL